MSYDKNFLNTFNEYYPFERYIVKTPKPINYLFDDALLTELFVPSTEIKPILNENGEFITFTSINYDEVYVKIKGTAGIMRFSYFDFSSSIREEIRNIIYQDFGKYEWEMLYVEHEEGCDELRNALKEQKELITQEYGICNIKDGFNISDTIGMMSTTPP